MDGSTSLGLGQGHCTSSCGLPSSILQTLSAINCIDLRPLILAQQKKGKNSIIVVVDGGPDWSVRSTSKLGELWKDLNLDLLVAVTYAPYNSRYNPIEHA